MGCPLVTLTTDFGLRDSYVAEMKAVILSISPKTTVVDISHHIDKFNVRMGAYVLASASPRFPEGTVHVAVVDPGVGTRRRPIIVQTDKGFFVGPDNGVLALAVKNIGGKTRVYSITNSEFMLPKVSSTFHGRDIFAPAAAHLVKGIRPAEFGPEIHQMLSPKFAKIIKRIDALEGQVIHVDDFGNIVTSFTEKEVRTMKTKDKLKVKVGNTELTLMLCTAYGDVEKQKPLAIIGSHNFLEISVNQGDAASTFKARVEDKVVMTRSD
ncbi:MAG: SAM-dependent chlorinase/fluorinase [Candidatus Bathyarchaeia archaeon]|jgi:S-adenosylmethionine hydrolase